METPVVIIDQLERKLRLLRKKPLTKNVVTGFDGFVDSIRKAVRRRDASSATYYKTLKDFAGRVDGLSGKSGQIEMDVRQVKMGGNAPILANALGALGIKSTCVGSMGFPKRHQAFAGLSDKCNAVSLLQPGESNAIEFDDGKLILSDLGVFDTYDWTYIKKAVGLETLTRTFLEGDVIALVDWANLRHAENIWEGVREDIIKPSGKNFSFFFDLCDPSKKTPFEIDEILDLISSFSFYGSVTLGLNQNEAMTIWSFLTGVTQTGSIEEAGKFIYYAMDIDRLLIHPIDRTIVFQRKKITELPGRVVAKPKIQTGGGDNLNAGYILGLLSGFSLEESMIMGMAASGSYIQEGKSASVDDIQKYLAIWRAELESISETTEKHKAA
jgi:hypothetical protein